MAEATGTNYTKMRHWCKTCEIFIDDNAIARKHHEQSSRHKNRLQRILDAHHRKNREASTNWKSSKSEKKGMESDSEEYESSIGQWEAVEPIKRQPIKKLGSPLRDPEEDEGRLKKTQWEPSTKQVDLDTDEEEESEVTVFKKRKTKS